tara:strand:- start:760 stop:1410 length:651 start_codon:yes stop_codon:yes gene_type:complete
MSFNRLSQLNILAFALFLNSCSSIDNTWDTISESVESAGDYIYDSVNFWEDDEEPEQSDAIIIEEAVEVPDYALPDQDYLDQNQNMMQIEQQAQTFQPTPSTTYFNPIYRSQRQYYYVGPNGTPLPAPPPPPFPQYSIDQSNPVPFSYTNNFGYPMNNNNLPNSTSPPRMLNTIPQINAPTPMSKDEEMELFGIQNNCIRVIEDYVNGGYMCDDFE